MKESSVTVLGCGSSNGTPQIGCDCYVCTSSNPKNQRLRPSVFFDVQGCKILVDATPDLRTQALENNIKHVDALIITHAHADHIAGLDDMRYFAFQHPSKTIPIYATKDSMRYIKEKFSYLFEKKSKIYNPIFQLHLIDYYDDIIIEHRSDNGVKSTIRFNTMRQIHGEIFSLGLRLGDFAYSTDFKYLEPECYKKLDGISNWIIDCQKYHWSPSHLNYELSLKNIERVGPKNAYLTHLAHDFCYDELISLLPNSISPAYDKMRLPIIGGVSK